MVQDYSGASPPDNAKAKMAEHWRAERRAEQAREDDLRSRLTANPVATALRKASPGGDDDD